MTYLLLSGPSHLLIALVSATMDTFFNRPFAAEANVANILKTPCRDFVSLIFTK